MQSAKAERPIAVLTLPALAAGRRPRPGDPGGANKRLADACLSGVAWAGEPSCYPDMNGDGVLNLFDSCVSPACSTRDAEPPCAQRKGALK